MKNIFVIYEYHGTGSDYVTCELSWCPTLSSATIAQKFLQNTKLRIFAILESNGWREGEPFFANPIYTRMLEEAKKLVPSLCSLTMQPDSEFEIMEVEKFPGSDEVSD